MKRLLLGSLLSCMLVGQVFGEGYWIDLKGKIDGAAEGLALGGLVGFGGSLFGAVACYDYRESNAERTARARTFAAIFATAAAALAGYKALCSLSQQEKEEEDVVCSPDLEQSKPENEDCSSNGYLVSQEQDSDLVFLGVESGKPLKKEPSIKPNGQGILAGLAASSALWWGYRIFKK